ncbi:hypothetical protein ACHAXA_011505 [Cyclostephanos tholiformis]|uniref:Uncharacterized protein n=1 Tax=Cyclostephanos tholiformis TaxID=382380 RepID=A0ABD3SDT4_9STRA
MLSQSRYVAAATERRRLRKQQHRLVDNEHKEASHDSNASGDFVAEEKSCNENVQPEYNENKNVCRQPRGLACDRTSSLTFDDSTVSSKDFSWLTENSGKRGLTQPPTLITAMPSRSILCQSKKSEHDSKTAMTYKPSTTPRHSNIGLLHNTMGKPGTSTVDTTSLNRTDIANTPRNNSGSATPKHKNITTPKQNKFHGDSLSVISAVTTLEKMKILTEERDKCRADIAMFKRKLNTAIEKKNTATQEKEQAIQDFEGRLSRLEKELELTKAQKQYADYQLKVMEKKMNEHTDEKVSSLTKELNHIKNKLKESSVEFAKVQQFNAHLKNEKDQAETREKTLKCELKKAEEDRKCMKNWLREGSENLQHMEKEYQVSP